MARRKYIGARYVPVFGRQGEESVAWDNNKDYEPLTIVLHNGSSYTSRQYVPVGIDIANETYWAQTGNYNAQIEGLQEEIADKPFVFDTVALMQACTILAAGDICHTNGFHSSGDGGAAWYVISSSTDVETLGMDVIGIPSNEHPTLYANLVVTESYVTPEMFGAYGDGTHDDTDAINTAIAFTANRVALEFLSKTYLVTPQGTKKYIFTTPITESIEIRGINGSIIKIADNGGLYRGIIGFRNTENIYVHDLCFDHNCENNTFETESEYLNDGRYTLSNYALSICELIKIENVTVYNCDSIVSFYFPSLQGSVFDSFSALNNTWINAQNVNNEVTANYDQSYINAVGKNILVTGNTFLCKSWNVACRTAMELHHIDSVKVANNVVDKFTSGMHICSGTLDQKSKSAVVVGNVFNVSADALNLWCYRRSAESTLLIGSEDLLISNNVFNMCPDEYCYESAAAFPAIRFYNYSGGTIAYKNVVIDSNIIRYSKETSDAYTDITGSSPWGAIHCRYNNDTLDSHIYNLTIKDNEIFDCPYCALLIEYATLKNTIISGNRFENCGSHYNDKTIAHVNQFVSIFCTLESDLLFKNNTIIDDIVDSKIINYIFVKDYAAVPTYYFNVYDNDFDIASGTNHASNHNYIGSVNNYELVRFSGKLPTASGPRLPIQNSLYGAKAIVENVEYVKLSTAPNVYWNRIEYASTVPNTTSGYRNGDIVYNIAPSAGGYIGWVLASNTWKGFGLVES